jgi:transcriptional regulator with XRE-family HTH domain
MELRKIVGNNLRRIRLARAFTQEELADRAGINRNYVGMIERGENAATVDTIEVLAKALSVDAAELFLRP